ncbi:MAG: hypothetical protein WC366_02570 [Bacilli bacterium]|jgi:hypothetical protein
MYEFVSKNELKPVKAKIDLIIRNLQRLLKQDKITFKSILVGSAKKHLVTRLVDGNKGFDFDYNLSLQKCPDNISPKELKTLFLSRLNIVLEDSGYKKAENNTQSMTIKFLDSRNSRIIHSCDIAIVSDHEEEGETFQKILIFDKSNKKYIWNKRPLVKNYSAKLSSILSNGLWHEVKEEYLNLKNTNNDSEKKSFQLYLEALNNVYNHYDWN